MAGAGTAYPADAVSGSPTYTATQGRTAMAGAMGGATTARPLGGFSGVRPGTPSSIASATSTTWTVTAFGGYIDLESSATNGGYFFSFQSTSTGTVTAAAGSARVDLLYVQIADSNTGDGTSGAPRVILDYQAGTAGAGIPTLSAARAFVIAQINVPASGGGSPTVTWVAPYATAAGAPIWSNTLALLPAATGLNGQHATVFADSTTLNNGDYISNGTAWVQAIGDTGWIAATLSNSWVNFGGAYQNAMYRRLNGMVILKGLIKSGTVASGTILMNLPAGFRPTAQDQYPAVSNNAFAPVEVKANGDVITGAGVSTASLSLAGVKFVAEQ